MNADCRVCGGTGDVCDEGRWRSCYACAGRRREARAIRPAVVAALCLGAAVLGSLTPCGWWLP